MKAVVFTTILGEGLNAICDYKYPLSLWSCFVLILKPAPAFHNAPIISIDSTICQCKLPLAETGGKSSPFSHKSPRACLHRLYFIVSVISKEVLAGLVPAKCSLSMTPVKILTPFSVWHGSCWNCKTASPPHVNFTPVQLHTSQLHVQLPSIVNGWKVKYFVVNWVSLM